MSKVSGLDGWLQRITSLDAFRNNDRVPDREAGCFIGIDEVVPAHTAPSLRTKSLSESWHEVRDFMSRALGVVSMEEPMWLDREEVEMITEELGNPPPTATPIYFISVGDGDDERVVYIGKTSSDNSRFKGGHAALTKLLAPKYDGKAKHIYLGSLVFLCDDDYVPVEWLKPLDKAEQALKSIEAQLIFDLQPELNSDHRSRFNSRWPTPIMIENYSDRPKFLHYYSSCGPKGNGRRPYVWSEDT